jgi:hypothetical protein
MTNEEKQKRIRQWIDPEERITVHFLDSPDLNTKVTNCTDQLMDLSIETQVPHMAQASQSRSARLRCRKTSPTTREIPTDPLNDSD